MAIRYTYSQTNRVPTTTTRTPTGTSTASNVPVPTSTASVLTNKTGRGTASSVANTRSSSVSNTPSSTSNVSTRKSCITYTAVAQKTGVAPSVESPTITTLNNNVKTPAPTFNVSATAVVPTMLAFTTKPSSTTTDTAFSPSKIGTMLPEVEIVASCTPTMQPTRTTDVKIFIGTMSDPVKDYTMLETFPVGTCGYFYDGVGDCGAPYTYYYYEVCNDGIRLEKVDLPLADTSGIDDLFYNFDLASALSDGSDYSTIGSVAAGACIKIPKVGSVSSYASRYLDNVGNVLGGFYIVNQAYTMDKNNWHINGYNIGKTATAMTLGYIWPPLALGGMGASQIGEYFGEAFSEMVATCDNFLNNLTRNPFQTLNLPY